jgi:hypothetical protein
MLVWSTCTVQVLVAYYVGYSSKDCVAGSAVEGSFA